MTVANYDEAVDEMFTQFNLYWKRNTPQLLSYVPEIRWQGDGKRELPDASKYWCRLSAQNLVEEQATLSENVTQPGQKRYNSKGLLFVQLFCPKSEANALEIGRKLAHIAKSAYRGKNTSSGIWYSGVVIKDLPDEENSYRFNIIARYEYDEIG